MTRSFEDLVCDEPALSASWSRDMSLLAAQLTLAFELVGPDLKSRGLARWYADAVVRRLAAGSSTPDQFEQEGRALFYWVGRDVLGPITSHFVDAAMTGFQGHLVFPRRDADSLYVVAISLIQLHPTRYRLDPDHLHNPNLTRGVLGIPDERAESDATPSDPAALNRLLRSVGFGSGEPVRLVDIGCWGTVVDALKRRNPEDQLSVWFLFSHMPGRLYGYLNDYGRDVPTCVLETIADSWEAVPKLDLPGPWSFPVVSCCTSSDVFAPSLLLRAWAQSLLLGMQAAARAFARNSLALDQTASPCQAAAEVRRLTQLVESVQAGGPFCGLLPHNTETWSGGEVWSASWAHGAVPPIDFATACHEVVVH
jgi:hypothetical protein